MGASDVSLLCCCGVSGTGWQMNSTNKVLGTGSGATGNRSTSAEFFPNSAGYIIYLAMACTNWVWKVVGVLGNIWKIFRRVPGHWR